MVGWGGGGLSPMHFADPLLRYFADHYGSKPSFPRASTPHCGSASRTAG